MISAFLESWSLFGRVYLLTVLSAAVLAVTGVVVVARRQVFMAAALSQASTCGYAAVTLLAGGATSGFLVGPLRDAVTVGSAALAALALLALSGRGREGDRLDGDEATAWLFIVSSAAAILMLAGTPAGAEQFRRMQASSVIGAGTLDIVIFAGLLVAAAALLSVVRRPLILLLSDPVMAAAVGMRLRLWDVVLALITGLVVGFAVRSTGMLFAFGCLTLPTLLGKQWCGEIGQLFWAAPLVAAVTAIAGLVLSFQFNLPPGQVVVAALAGGVLLSVLGRGAWDRAARYAGR